MVQRVRGDEAGRLREQRLRALSDAPDAFRSTWQREAAFGDDEWADLWGTWVDPVWRGGGPDGAERQDAQAVLER